MTEHDDDFITGDEFDPEVAAAADDKRYEAATDNEAKIIAHIERTRSAYRAVFQSGNASPDDVDFVLRDPAWFAKVDQPYFPDARFNDLMSGRKQVLQRVFEYTKLDRDDLIRRYMQTQA